MLCGEVDKVAGRVVWLLSWVVFPVVWLAVVWPVSSGGAAGLMVTGGELGPILRPALASVTGKVTCDLLVWPEL